MRIRIAHATTYRYASPPGSVTQTLRLTPRNFDSQYVVDWRIELSQDCQLTPHQDAFGNVTHTFTAAGPFDELRVSVEGIVDTQDTHGVVTGTIERFPASLFLRPTALTEPDAAIVALADASRDAGGGTLAILHRLMATLYAEITFDTDPTHAATTAAEAYGLRRGVCQDIAHIFIAAARHLDVPARYVSGYFHRADGVTDQEAGHAWAEAFVEGLGWVAFDPTNGISATDAHVRVAIGLDYLGAAPIRGMHYGGGGETMDVAVAVEQARHQFQN
ncbi:MAG: transglutaminase domain-containing protein [Xanthobacteraceae bacterium]|uniref:transglutaminase family protein n=1 Tax=Pseudolabrys sp. TaxID=1960880 RepID=UPI003D0DDE21